MNRCRLQEDDFLNHLLSNLRIDDFYDTRFSHYKLVLEWGRAKANEELMIAHVNFLGFQGHSFAHDLLPTRYDCHFIQLAL